MQTTEIEQNPKKSSLTTQILIAMLLGAACGLAIKVLPEAWHVGRWATDGIFNIGGAIFVNLIKMLVVPLVFVSLTCGICNLNDIKKLGKIGGKSLVFFIITTALAVMLAVTVADLLQVGEGINFPHLSAIPATTTPSLQQLFINIVPSNPFQALAEANVLQIVVFAIIFGVALNLTGEAGKRIVGFFNDMNVVVMKTVAIVMRTTPYGVFCLIAILFAKLGVSFILQLLNYFLVVVLVLAVHTFVVYGVMLKVLAGLSLKKFFQKIYGVMLFAFSVASSNASLPLVLDTVERKMGVDNSVASLVLSLGVNINKNGTAIMQGVAAIFISNAYNIDIGFTGNIMIIVTTILASISTAGVPSVGILALVLVLEQVGLPVEGIALILAVDRLLDMLRTAVSVAGNAVIACVIGRDEQKIDLAVYNS